MKWRNAIFSILDERYDDDDDDNNNRMVEEKENKKLRRSLAGIGRESDRQLEDVRDQKTAYLPLSALVASSLSP